MNINWTEQQALDLLRKALSVDGATGQAIAPFMKEDLEDEAYVSLYSESDPAQMSLLKDLPRQTAQQVNHEFVLVDRYGNHKTKASFAANALPAEANIDGSKKNVQLKLYGKTSAVQGLTVLQNTIKALGQSDIAGANDAAVKLLMQYQINAEVFHGDTRDTLDTNGFKGVFQLIDELTKSPSATTSFSNGDIFIDMRGQPLLPDGKKGIRSQAVAIGKRNGMMRRIYLAPELLETLETNLDPSARFWIQGSQSGSNTKGLILGNTIDGMRIQGGIVYFRRDNALSAFVKTSQEPNAVLIPGAPAQFAYSGGGGAGTFGTPAINNSGVGKFQTTGERLTGVYYVVAALNDIGESIASGASATVTAVAGKTVEFAIRPRGDEKSFKIYRAYTVDAAQPGTFMEPIDRAPKLIAEIPNGASLGNTTPITFIDDDHMLPGTTWAWGTDVNSDNASAIDQGNTPSSPTNQYSLGRSAVALAQLTGLFEFDLAKLGWLHSNKLFAQVLAPMVPRPWVNVVWFNVGGVEIKEQLLDRPA